MCTYCNLVTSINFNWVRMKDNHLGRGQDISNIVKKSAWCLHYIWTNVLAALDTVKSWSFLISKAPNSSMSPKKASYFFFQIAHCFFVNLVNSSTFFIFYVKIRKSTLKNWQPRRKKSNIVMWHIKRSVLDAWNHLFVYKKILKLNSWEANNLNNWGIINISQFLRVFFLPMQSIFNIFKNKFHMWVQALKMFLLTCHTTVYEKSIFLPFFGVVNI